MTTYCRLCAEFKEPAEIITTISDTERLIEEKLIACCQWNVTKTEQQLPQDVCMFCMDKLDQCWLFSQSVQSAQQKLLEQFGKMWLFRLNYVRILFLKCFFSNRQCQ